MKKILLILLVISLNIAFSSEHNHKSSSSEVKDLGDKKFIPTDDLKVRMEKILTLIKKVQTKKNDSNEVKKIGKGISIVVSDIFKTCKLENDADEAIHPVLAGILQGAAAFEKGDYKIGLSSIHKSLMDYEKLFAHDGWMH
jgi:hypothetical protein